MPQKPSNGLRALSLFSGGGGLDLGFDRAGFRHMASFDILPETAAVLKAARPDWEVHAGDNGDVTRIDWKSYRSKIDVLHGGPPCQPFSHAGGRRGAADVRDMIPEFGRAVLAIEPKAFILENVPGLATKKFAPYVKEMILDRLGSRYQIQMLVLEAADFGVPQRRKRVFFVGFRNRAVAKRYKVPSPTHARDLGAGEGLPVVMGARQALGLPDIGLDGLVPTLRSGLTGPRHSTSVVNSATAMRQWEELQIWPNGVAPDRDAASRFAAKNGTFRLSIPDCLLLQGFPADWPIKPPVYKALGLIGNSVAPPMAYAVACSVADVLAGG
ncbi:DNA cytosine methyltransferase [Microvirga roseola]|uniref:DNA cytosine methyltransferase n=1 Tax=Microvirga roseola TaxID=2883126 RepID=UPI0038992B2A